MSKSASFPYPQALFTLLVIVVSTITTPTSPSSVLEDQNPPISENVSSQTRPSLQRLDTFPVTVSMDTLFLNDPPQESIRISETPSSPQALSVNEPLEFRPSPDRPIPSKPSVLEDQKPSISESVSSQTRPFPQTLETSLSMDELFLNDPPEASIRENPSLPISSHPSSTSPTGSVLESMPHALSTNAPPESSPSPSLQTDSIPQPSTNTAETTSPPKDASIQTFETDEATVVIYDFMSEIIPDYFTLTRQYDDRAESSNARALEQDRHSVFVYQGGASVDLTQDTEGFKASIQRIFEKYLPLGRRNEMEGDEFTFELISHELFSIFGIGFQVNIYFPFTKYVKQVLDTLPEGDGTGFEYADAIEKIAYKLLEIAAAMKDGKKSLKNRRKK